MIKSFKNLLNKKYCPLCACAKNYKSQCTKNKQNLLKKDNQGKLDCPEFDYE